MLSGTYIGIEIIRRKKLKLAAAQHQQSFSFFCPKEREREGEMIIQKMDKVEYVDWPTQNVDRDETYTHTLVFIIE
jgi:hypothetical protein